MARAKEILARFSDVLVAFSGGVDSSLLLALAAHSLPPERVLAVTAVGAVVSAEDEKWARSVAGELGVTHCLLTLDYLDIPGFAANAPKRCYVCRRALYVALEELRRKRGLEVVLDGVIAGDAGDYRPGLRAAAEAGVRSPLAEAGFTKEEVRAACRALGLAVAERPASPCLASRFPYGEPITAEALRMVGRAETLLREWGFREVRVRHHGRLARIEVPVEQVPSLVEEPLRSQVMGGLRELGYLHVCVDLLGFRSGSLNEALDLPGADAPTG
jgi:uncharacterized protein